MKRWTWKENKKWAITEESDVQSILFLILRSVFEDIEYEDPTTKFGHRSSRLDLKIPSLKLIIEIKFIKSKNEFSKVEDEIKIDSINYLKSTDYRKIIVFIYDNTSSVQEHQTTIKALNQIEGIEDTIIVSKPSLINSSP